MSKRPPGSGITDEMISLKREREDEVDDDDSDDGVTTKRGRGRAAEDRRSRHCPYLDTINRQDWVKWTQPLLAFYASYIHPWLTLFSHHPAGVCWILTSRSSAPSLSHISTSMRASYVGNTFKVRWQELKIPRRDGAPDSSWTESYVFFLAGRGQKSHAYTHSVQFSHHVFLNLHTLKFYCLPDNYEIIDSSLEDITYVLKPTFTKQHIGGLDKHGKLYRAYDGTTYLPGIVGLNNIKANDYANAVLQAFSNVPPLRNYFLEEENYKDIRRPPGDIMFLLVQRFGELMRKLWNPRNFKAHVSPHEMLQAVVLCSKKTFQITKQGDAVDFMTWFLNALHGALGGTKKKPSIITKVFQGSMRIFSKKLPHPDLLPEEKEALLQTEEYQEQMSESTFLFLTLDLPTAPLYKDEKEQLIIPQVPLFNILGKFNGNTEKEYKTYKENFLKRFQLTKLPPYLIFCIKRFTKNNFFVEKNPTIVNFPITYVDKKKRKMGQNSYLLFFNMTFFMLPFNLLPQERRPFRVPHRRSSGYREEYVLRPCGKHRSRWKTY
uniref:ubiquitinyl hydrolase 1 n=1 Tax=Fundulus heteroclitus TaxID=8078 RepID=A0A3Q2PQN9_FUNHE